MPEKPNVIFILTDDQGYGDTGFGGNTIIDTPNLDKLHSESVCFTDYHTGPTCAPTRASLLTGRYHNATGVWHTIGGRSLLRRDEVTLAEAFKGSGYTTGIFGKWHLGDSYPYRPQDRGFDAAVVHGGGGIGQTPDYWGNDYFDDTYFDKGSPRGFRGYCTDVFFDLGAKFIEDNRETPFFCYIPTNAPHIPLQVDESYVEPYKNKAPENRARFYGMISCIDKNIGFLRVKLQQLGLAEKTIFIFMTDNGTDNGCVLDENNYVIDGYNMGMRGKKSSPYEGGHRTPFLLHWPDGGISQHTDIDILAASIDFMPTLADLCGLKYDTERFHGKSLVPLMRGETVDWMDRIIVTDSQRVATPAKWRESCCMQGKWRLINGCELYNLTFDAGQRKNIVAEYADIAEHLRLGYENWWETVSKRFDEDIPLYIGSEAEGAIILTSHDIRGSDNDVAWNQKQIRLGRICDSYWEVFAGNTGWYDFELRRWPAEEPRAITGGIEGEINDWWSGGTALPIISASLKIGDNTLTKQVLPGQCNVKFEVWLDKGPYHLYASFTDREGIGRTAYYVYVVFRHIGSLSGDNLDSGKE